jgi:hypothetical protein
MACRAVAIAGATCQHPVASPADESAMNPAAPDVLTLLFQGLASPFALLVMVWAVVAALLGLMPDMPRLPQRLVGIGLGLAMVTGLASLALARPFLTEGQALLSSLWPFGAGLLMALGGVALALWRRSGGQRR